MSFHVQRKLRENFTAISIAHAESSQMTSIKQLVLRTTIQYWVILVGDVLVLPQMFNAIYKAHQLMIPGFMVHLPTFWGGIAAILILYYDKDTCVTTALLITWENELGSKICENIKMVKADWSNPSILLLETLRHVSEIVTDSITERRASLQNINRMTGHFKYAGEDYVDALNANSIDLDFLSTSRALNECGQSAAKATACSFSLLRVLEQIQIFRSQTGNLPQKAKLEEEGCLIDERIRISTEEYEVLLLESQALEKQNSVLLQVVRLNYIFLKKRKFRVCFS